MSEERLERIETKVDGLETRFDDLGRHMRVLHEDLVGRIADLAPDYAPIRREFKEADAELRESIEVRLQPLEAAERLRRNK